MSFGQKPIEVRLTRAIRIWALDNGQGERQQVEGAAQASARRNGGRVMSPATHTPSTTPNPVNTPSAFQYVSGWLNLSAVKC